MKLSALKKPGFLEMAGLYPSHLQSAGRSKQIVETAAIPVIPDSFLTSHTDIIVPSAYGLFIPKFLSS
jgi:hypothetical protein